MKYLVALWIAFAFVNSTQSAEEAGVGLRIVAAAREQMGVTKGYDPKYVVLQYPGGDVPRSTGVCSDVVVRALRCVGVDLQKEVHEDMKRSFADYPQRWGLRKADKNIDHRRVPNLMRYFERHHIALEEKLQFPESYRPGDIVAWNLGGGLQHIGIVSDKVTGRVPWIIHNIGSGATEEDVLLKYKVIGHYRVKAVTLPAAATFSRQETRSRNNRQTPAVGSR